MSTILATNLLVVNLAIFCLSSLAFCRLIWFGPFEWFQAPWPWNLLVNVGLLCLFGLQHSGMARQRCKRALSTFVVEPLSRPLYVLASGICLLVLATSWQSLSQDQPFYEVEWPASLAVFVVHFFGWLLFGLAAAGVDGRDLLGVNHIKALRSGNPVPRPRLRDDALYAYVRHPLMLGLMLVIWSTAVWTADRLLLNIGLTSYMIVGSWLEERDLLQEYGEQYAHYRRRVPMFWPRLRKV